MIHYAIRRVLPCGLAVAIASAATSQQPAAPLRQPAPQHAVSSPDHTAVFSQSFGMSFVDGALRAGGPGYKARFDAQGVEYTPALGAAAPRNMPVRLALRSIRRDGATLFEASTSTPTAPRRAGMIARYDRGQGVVETYEARVDGLKQNFTFATLPPGSGDLVVECDLETELVGPPGKCDQGLELQLAGVGGVRIGEVVGVDALDRRVVGSMRYDGASLRFVLPAAFVAEAAYPMVLDPVISTTAQINTSPAKDPDVAYDETFNQFLVVWEHQYSALDLDVRGQKVGTQGQLVQGAHLITSGAGTEINPTVANVDAGSDFFVCWQRGPSPFGPWNLDGRRVDGGQVVALGATIAVTPSGSGATDPDASGDNSQLSGPADGVIVVYNGNPGIGVVKVDVSASAVVAGPTQLTTDPEAANPAISKSGGVTGRHALAFEADNGDLWGALVDRDLQVLDPLFFIESGPQQHTLKPDIDGDGESWMVVYQQRQSLSSTDHDIYCKRLTYGGSTVTAGAAVFVGGGTLDDRDPAIGYLGTKYFAAWAQFSGASGSINHYIRLIELDALTCLTCGVETSTLGGYCCGLNVNLNPEIATRYSARHSNQGNVNIDQGMVVWMNTPETPPFEGDLAADLYEAFGGGAVTDLGGSCGAGGGGVNGFNGPVALGNSALRLTLTGAPGDLTLVSIMFNANTAVSCIGCEINADASSYLFAPAVNGDSSYPLGVPCNTGFLGQTLYTQWATVFSGQSPCPILPPSLELSYSNRLSVTFAP